MMENITIDKLVNMIKIYDPNSEKIIREAYKYADYLHQGQKDKVESHTSFIHWM